MTSLYAIAAQAVLVLHFAWIMFVVTGAFYLRKHAKLRWVHLASVIYSVGIEVFAWTCPLTHLERILWGLAGRDAYQGAFIQHYLERIVYFRAPQPLLVAGATIVLLVTLAVYFWPTRARSERSGAAK